MGVEHFMVCKKCKQYIDLHKAYWFRHTIENYRPPLAENCKEDAVFARYWNGRGIWFLWNHRDHGDKIEIYTDAGDEWWTVRYDLEEVYRSEADFNRGSNE